MGKTSDQIILEIFAKTGIHEAPPTGLMGKHIDTCGAHNLLCEAIEAASAQARREALEEAANKVEAYQTFDPAVLAVRDMFASVIRALLGKGEEGGQ